MINAAWWADFRVNHVRYRKRSPDNSKAGARAYETTLRQKLARGESIDWPKQEAEQNTSFEEFAWRWYREYVATNNKYSEQRTKKHIIANSLVPFFRKRKIADIAASDVERYKARLARDGVSRKTINNRLSILNTCLTMAYGWLNLETRQPRIKRLKCPVPRTDYLLPEEASLLLGTSTGTIHELILTALRTGMRQGELKGLQWESIDWQSGNLIVRRSRCDHRKILDTPKSNRERHVPLDREVFQALSGRRKRTGYVFLDHDGQTARQIHLTSLNSETALRTATGWAETAAVTVTLNRMVRGRSPPSRSPRNRRFSRQTRY
jgi:integrase